MTAHNQALGLPLGDEGRSIRLKLELQQIYAQHSKNRQHITWWESPPKRGLNDSFDSDFQEGRMSSCLSVSGAQSEAARGKCEATIERRRQATSP
jgi:hypothetical protein